MFAAAVAEVEGFDDLALDLHARELEVEARRLEARRLAVTAEMDRRKHGRPDGYASVVAWLRGTLGWSGDDCYRHMQLVRLIVAHPSVGDSLAAGEISLANARAIARAWANKRVRDRFDEFLGFFLREAEHAEHDDFALIVDRFVMLADIDGAHEAREHHHEARNAHFTEFQGKGTLIARFGDLDTEINRNVFDHQVQAEWEADWAWTVQHYGDDATVSLMPRTDAQRRADAVTAIFRRAAITPPAPTADDPEAADEPVEPAEDAPAPPVEPVESASAPPVEPAKPVAPGKIVTNIFLDYRSFQDLLAWAGLFPEQQCDPFENPGTLPSQWRCETGDGHLIDPVTVLHAMLEQYVRFVVLDDEGVPIHWGRERRLFRGAARDAVMSLACRCTAPGCRVPASRSEADHLQPWSEGGRTDPDNGGPKCKRHNLLRNRGYMSVRTKRGWHTYRPDGTELR